MFHFYLISTIFDSREEKGGRKKKSYFHVALDFLDWPATNWQKVDRVYSMCFTWCGNRTEYKINFKPCDCQSRWRRRPTAHSPARRTKASAHLYILHRNTNIGIASAVVFCKIIRTYLSIWASDLLATRVKIVSLRQCMRAHDRHRILFQSFHLADTLQSIWVGFGINISQSSFSHYLPFSFVLNSVCFQYSFFRSAFLTSVRLFGFFFCECRRINKEIEFHFYVFFFFLQNSRTFDNRISSFECAIFIFHFEHRLNFRFDRK